MQENERKIDVYIYFNQEHNLISLLPLLVVGLFFF